MKHRAEREIFVREHVGEVRIGFGRHALFDLTCASLKQCRVFRQ